MKKNDGKDYELFVARLQQAIFASDEITTQKTITVEVNKILIDNNDIERQFDVYWEYEMGGFVYKTVIECKDYNTSVSIEKIDALLGKIADLPDIRAVFATKTGYQSGAIKKAEKHKIDLLIVREQNASDWVTSTGEPLIKTVVLSINAIIPSRILSFEPNFDIEWIKKNTNFQENIVIQGQTNTIFIEDLDKGTTYGLMDLPQHYPPPSHDDKSIVNVVEDLVNAFVIHENIRVKILGFKASYSPFNIVKTEEELDFSKEIDGVVEYLQRKSKTSVLKNGVVHKDIPT